MFLPLILGSVNVFNANGKSNVTLILEIIKTVLAVIPVSLGILFDIQALLWGLVASTLLSWLVHAAFVSREIDYPILRQIGDILPFVLISAFMSAVVHFVGLLQLEALPLLLVQLAAGFVIVMICYELIYKPEEYTELKVEILKILHIRKK
jgi:hypothetical protein